MPGTVCSWWWSLITPVCHEQRLRFAIREGGARGRRLRRGDWNSRGFEWHEESSTFQCTECKNRNYTKTKNKKTTTERLEMSKVLPHCRKHQPAQRDQVGRPRPDYW